MFLPHELLLYIWLHLVDDQSHPNNNEKVKKKKLSKVGVLLFKIVDPTMQESDDDKWHGWAPRPEYVAHCQNDNSGGLFFPQPAMTGVCSALSERRLRWPLLFPAGAWIVGLGRIHHPCMQEAHRSTRQECWPSNTMLDNGSHPYLYENEVA